MGGRTLKILWDGDCGFGDEVDVKGREGDDILE
jgi:hypothetical protein